MVIVVVWNGIENYFIILNDHFKIEFWISYTDLKSLLYFTCFLITLYITLCWIYIMKCLWIYNEYSGEMWWNQMHMWVCFRGSINHNLYIITIHNSAKGTKMLPIDFRVNVGVCVRIYVYIWFRSTSCRNCGLILEFSNLECSL